MSPTVVREIETSSDDVNTDAAPATGELHLTIDVEPEETVADQRMQNTVSDSGTSSATASQAAVLHVLLIRLIMLTLSQTVGF